MASKIAIKPIAQVYRNSHEYWIRGLHGRAIMSRKQFTLVLSQATCRGSKLSIQSRGNSEYPTLQPNKAPATVALHVAWPPCIASSVIAVLFIWKIYIIIYTEKTKQTNKHKTTTTKNNYKKQISSNLSPTSWGFNQVMVGLNYLQLFQLNTQPPDLEIKTLAMLCIFLLSITFKVYLSLRIRFCKFTTSSLAHPPPPLPRLF